MRGVVAAAEVFRPASIDELVSKNSSGKVDVVPSVRPKVAELVFQLYGRSLHPELFDIRRSCSFERGDYACRLDVTGAGHVVTWRCGGLTLTEVAADVAQPLPLKRRLMSYKLRGEHNDRLECRGGVTYQVSFQLEKVADRALFWTFQQELARDEGPRSLLYSFNGGDRLALGALSAVRVEPRRRSLLVQTFHTFPDDFAIVKTQSLFEIA